MSGPRDALAFLTRLPVRPAPGLDAARLARAAAWFPAVGLLVGAAVGGTRIAADELLSAQAATVLALAVGILLTGALHEDGLADSADGLGAHVVRERRLEIMRDPRVGTYGALALIVSLLLAWSLLSALTAEDCLRAAAVAHAAGRCAMLLHARALPAARSDGSGALFRPTAAALFAAAATTLAAALLIAGPVDGAVAVAAALVTAAAVGALVRRMLGGVTGDTLGALGKLVELAALAALTATWTA